MGGIYKLHSLRKFYMYCIHTGILIFLTYYPLLGKSLYLFKGGGMASKKRGGGMTSKKRGMNNYSLKIIILNSKFYYM